MDALTALNPFKSYLFAGERILWSGQPKQGLMLSAKDSFLIPFSLLWGGFAIFWNAGVWFADLNSNSGDGPGWFFKLWGLPFLVIGIYLIIGRFFHDARIRKGLYYAVTNQRVLTLRGKSISSLDIRRLPRLELSESSDGTGTLAFEASSQMAMSNTNSFNWWLPSHTGTAQFFRIENPRKVYDLVQRATQT